MKHCDAYLSDAAAPKCLRAFLEVARSSGPSLASGDPPALFATLKRDTPARDRDGAPFVLRLGQRVRVVMASQFGDVGITADLHDALGYSARVVISELDQFSESP